MEKNGELTTQELNDKLTVDWDKFGQTLCDDLRPNAIDPTNPYVPINSVMPMIEYQAARIVRLKRVVKQAIGCASLQIVTITEENAKDFYDGWRNIGKTVIAGIGSTERFIAGCEESDSDLYAELKRGEQNG